MIAHIVLFTPRPDLSQDARRDLLASVTAAAGSIPAVRRFRVGRRVQHGLPGYEQAMRDDYEYAAIIEFDDLDALKAYLAHPAHAAVGLHFATSSSRALAYDYQMTDSSEMVDVKW